MELRCIPQLLRRCQWRDLQVCPPGLFVAVPMQFLMVGATKWHRELIADLTAKSPLLREFQVMRITRRLLADKTGLTSHKQKMCLVALANFLRNRRDLFREARISQENERLGLRHFSPRTFGRMVAGRPAPKKRRREAFPDTQLRQFARRLLRACFSLPGSVAPNPAVHFRSSVQKALSELRP